MPRSVALLRSTSIAALTVFILAGCAHHDERTAPRQISIKDDPADHAPAKPQRAVYRPAPTQKASLAPAPGSPIQRHVVEAAPTPVTHPAKASPEPPLTPTSPMPPKTAALDPRPTTRAAPPLADLPAAAVPATEALKPVTAAPAVSQASAAGATPVVIKPAETRPTVEQRRSPPAAPVPVSPPATSPVEATPSPKAAQAQSAPQNATAPAAAASATATPTPPLAQPVTQTAPPAVNARADTAKAPAAQIAALDEDQRVATLLTRADTYMKAGRYQDARTLLEDAARGGNPKLIVALAETYDPLVLAEQYRRLSRTGDPDKAISLYERARNGGATDLDARISALRAAAGTRR